ncbi:phenylalanine--tRNA ligase subunit alpha [bacterium]|nr:phenylalanine--tRNA ligase subunit alpha [bacterium]
MTLTFTREQWNVFNALKNSEKEIAVKDIVSKTGLDNSMVMGTVVYGENEGWLTVREEKREELVLAENIAELLNAGLPERQMLHALMDSGRIMMRDLAGKAKSMNLPMSDIIKWGGLRGWFDKVKGELIITEAGKNAMQEKDADEHALLAGLKKGRIFLDELVPTINTDRVKSLLGKRGTLAKIKLRTIRWIQLTTNGQEAFSGDIKVVTEKTQLSSEDILSGDWQNIRLRQYDVTLPAERIYPAKIHLMQKVIQDARQAFLEMGFSEIVSPQAESAFWDFDALFQPQDHPARDMQDTFYLSNPKEARLPADDLVDRVRQTHENGWETGSTGWGYNWSLERAKQMVLRTHNTACTIRSLASDPKPPRKVFSVGKVFRNETVSYKHLPEFFQVDGIIIDEEANLSTLLGTLTEFYRKMGFEKMKFKPAFFPYTEPSAEVFVYMEKKKTWIELGGSGIFRPEVTEPFGCKVPVLAFGLGLDRLAMMRYGLNDIRELYWSDLDKIKEVPLCQ